MLAHTRRKKHITTYREKCRVGTTYPFQIFLFVLNEMLNIIDSFTTAAAKTQQSHKIFKYRRHTHSYSDQSAPRTGINPLLKFG